MMILKKMELENFLPFYLRTEIDFSPKDGNKIVLLKGKNGAGKSSTFAALNFVFFGSPVISAEKDEPLKIYDLVNTKKMTESDGIAFVRVHFDHESVNWSFMRKIKFKKICFLESKKIKYQMKKKTYNSSTFNGFLWESLILKEIRAKPTNYLQIYNL